MKITISTPNFYPQTWLCEQIWQADGWTHVRLAPSTGKGEPISARAGVELDALKVTVGWPDVYDSQFGRVFREGERYASAIFPAIVLDTPGGVYVEGSPQ